MINDALVPDLLQHDGSGKTWQVRCGLSLHRMWTSSDWQTNRVGEEDGVIATRPVTIANLIEEAHKNAREKGFWESRQSNDDVTWVLSRLALIHSEVSEAAEAYRKGDEAEFKEELADIAIRLADMCGGMGIDLEMEITRKMAINAKRPYLHGKRA